MRQYLLLHLPLHQFHSYQLPQYLLYHLVNLEFLVRQYLLLHLLLHLFQRSHQFQLRPLRLEFPEFLDPLLFPEHHRRRRQRLRRHYEYGTSMHIRHQLNRCQSRLMVQNHHQPKIHFSDISQYHKYRDNHYENLKKLTPLY